MSGDYNPFRVPYAGVARALLLSNSVSILLFLLRIIGGVSTRYWFLLWNLFLAWLPLLFAWLLVRHLRTHSWREGRSLLWTALWLGFLPNSFYLVSDLIHLHLTGEINILYDAVMFMSFIFNGYVAGFISLYMVHRALLSRFRPKIAHRLVALVLLACSYAIYLGRVLRWNTWDVLFSPAGILFDVSERFINPVAHPQVVVTTGTFFLLLSSMYLVIWRFVIELRAPAGKK